MTLLWESISNIDDSIGKSFMSGDDVIRSWFLVKQNLLPFILCGLYVVFSTIIGPTIMKNRKPFALRIPLIVFNTFLVVTYSILVFTIIFNLPKLTYQEFCIKGNIQEYGVTYKLTRCMWLLYLLKYVEFADTIFFVLRKKFNNISFLHVVHHTAIPIFWWMNLRTETNGMQSIPALINGFVHIMMYSYYGLSAIGPQMKPYLWWKKYLTIIQLVQFVLIVFYLLVVVPLSGCVLVKLNANIFIGIAVLFFALFAHFYINTFIKKVKPE